MNGCLLIDREDVRKQQLKLTLKGGERVSDHEGRPTGVDDSADLEDPKYSQLVSAMLVSSRLDTVSVLAF